jgi:hypothetical protein
MEGDIIPKFILSEEVCIGVFILTFLLILFHHSFIYNHYHYHVFSTD